MFTAEHRQFRLQEDGQICWQPQASNPLPGDPIAKLVKGDHPMAPAIELLSSAKAVCENNHDLKSRLDLWFSDHMKEVLGDLVALKAPQIPDAISAKPNIIAIAGRLYNHLGIVPRADIDALTGDLDADSRRVLRGFKVKLGPVLVFLYTMTKPAAIRLRGLLYSLYYGHNLPAACPKDGLVSYAVEGEKTDPEFQRVIGYPVFGNRAIRVDMMDRILNSIYDTADKGKFQAQHSWAEWLGCSIPDLYGILEDMGYKKVFDPADEAAEKEDEKKETAKENGELKKDEVSESSNGPETPDSSEKQPKEAVPEHPKAEKPQLATFLVKRGKAFQDNKTPQKSAQFSAKLDKKSNASKSKPGHDRKPRKDDHKAGKRNKVKEKKVYEFGPEKKEADSPFAILEALKKK